MARNARIYDADCTRCPRLAEFLVESHRRYPDYWCKPVPSFGDPAPRLLLVGLAPGMHGANRTGRPFTGDFAGILLYQTLYELGLATHAASTSADDPLRLRGVRIANAVKCVPPANKPTPAEIRRCNDYLSAELAATPSVRVLLALGRVAHESVLRSYALKLSGFPFAHGASHTLPGGAALIDSYHCSRYNTQTRRLTAGMFKTVVGKAAVLAGIAPCSKV